ncbi:MAG: hypothetical protein M3O50_22660 [Myxococcota bacterium]|nr:hypothetical protein [Myxococcota bacterium]
MTLVSCTSQNTESKPVDAAVADGADVTLPDAMSPTAAILDATFADATTDAVPAPEGATEDALADIEACSNEGGSCSAPPPDGTPSDGPSAEADVRDANPCSGSRASCNGTCTDLKTDTAGCGACGHDCAGATCGAGQCAPGVLTSVASSGFQQAPPVSMSVDSESVYWVTPGCQAGTVSGCHQNPAVMKSPKSGYFTPTMMYSVQMGTNAGQGGIRALAVDSTRVYFATEITMVGVPFPSLRTTLNSCPLAGCGAQPTVVYSFDSGTDAGPTTTITAIAVDGTSVYWATKGAPADGSIMKCPVGGCSQPTVLASGLGSPSALALDAMNVYWTTSPTGTVSGGTVMQCAVGGCVGPTTVAQSPDMPVSLAVDSANIYWTMSNGQTSSGMKIPIGGSTPTVMVAGLSGVAALAVDGKSVYWLSNPGGGRSGGAILKCAVGGCDTPTVLADSAGSGGAVFGSALALDSTSIYWAGFQPGVSSGFIILKAPK